VNTAQTFGTAISETFTVTDAQNTPGSIYFVQINETTVVTDAVFGKLLWNLIDDSQNPSWQNIGDSQTPGWTLIVDTQNPNWTKI